MAQLITAGMISLNVSASLKHNLSVYEQGLWFNINRNSEINTQTEYVLIGLFVYIYVLTIRNVTSM